MVSYARASEQIAQLELEAEQLLAKAEQADATPLQDGLTIPEEIARRQERQAALDKTGHHRSVADLEKKPEPGPNSLTQGKTARPDAGTTAPRDRNAILRRAPRGFSSPLAPPRDLLNRLFARNPSQIF